MSEKLRLRPRLDPVFRIKITLRHIRPAIWRRILVQPDLTLAQLGKFIEAAMGWSGRHLHDFRIGKEIYGEPDEDDDPYLLTRRRDDRQYKINHLFREPEAPIIYTYDFGDQWEHELKLESWDPREPQIEYPICIGGARACPPDDCGGPPGYAELLKAIKNPAHPDHRAMLEWLGRRFDPEAFSMDEATHRLAKKLRRRKNASKRS